MLGGARLKLCACLLALLLLPTMAQAQASQEACLSDQRADSRLSGKVTYVSFPHPGNPDVTISGYKIILLKPKCFRGEIFGEIKDETIRDAVLITNYYSMGVGENNTFFKTAGAKEQRAELDHFLKDKVGKMVTVRGAIRSFTTIYWISWPQIAVNSIALCEVAPKTSKVEKC